MSSLQTAFSCLDRLTKRVRSHVSPQPLVHECYRIVTQQMQRVRVPLST
jgi:hypothetical protein